MQWNTESFCERIEIDQAHLEKIRRWLRTLREDELEELENAVKEVKNEKGNKLKV